MQKKETIFSNNSTLGDVLAEGLMFILGFGTLVIIIFALWSVINNF